MKVKVLRTFIDRYTKKKYPEGTVVNFTEERIAEINGNLPGFIKPMPEERKPEKKPAAKTKKKAEE